MKVTKEQLKKIIRAEARRQAKRVKPLKEGFAVDEDQYFAMKKKVEKDMNEIYTLSVELEDIVYGDGAMDPAEIVERIQEVCDRWIR